MYGWRAKIGALIVCSDATCEAELHKMAPEGVAIYTSRMAFPGVVTAETVGKLWEEAEKAAGLLVPLDIDVITFCCTSGSFVRGYDADREITERIEACASSRLPNMIATTTSAAVLDAFKALEIGKVAVATPYVDELNRAAKKFLESEKISVVNIQGLAFREDRETTRQPPEVAYNLAKRVNIPEAEGIFISCTSLRTIEIIETLERDLGKPVVTSNQATMWNALKKAGVHGPINGYGKLLTLL